MSFDNLGCILRWSNKSFLKIRDDIHNSVVLNWYNSGKIEEYQ